MPRPEAHVPGPSESDEAGRSRVTLVRVLVVQVVTLLLLWWLQSRYAG